MAYNTRNGAVFGFIAKHASDPERSIAFYRDIFDWTGYDDEGQPGTFMKRKRSMTPEAVFFGSEGAGDVPVGQWIPHIAVDDIHAAAARCVELGGDIVQEIHQVSDDDPGMMCRIRDPEGGILGLVQVARD